LDAKRLDDRKLSHKTKKAIPLGGSLFKEARRRDKLREGDARRRSDKRNARIGEVDISGRGLQTSVSWTSLVVNREALAQPKLMNSPCGSRNLLI